MYTGNATDRYNIFQSIVSTFTNNNNTTGKSLALTDFTLTKLDVLSFERIRELNYSIGLLDTTYDVYCLKTVHIFEKLNYDIFLYDVSVDKFIYADTNNDNIVNTMVIDNMLYIITKKDSYIPTGGVLLQSQNVDHRLFVSDTDISSDNIVNLKSNLYMSVWFNYIDITNVTPISVYDATIKNDVVTTLNIKNDNAILVTAEDDALTITNKALVLYTCDNIVKYMTIDVPYIFWNKDKAIFDKDAINDAIGITDNSTCEINHILLILDENLNTQKNVSQIYTDILRFTNTDNIISDILTKDCVGYNLRDINSIDTDIDFDDESYTDKVDIISPAISTIIQEHENSIINNRVDYDTDDSHIYIQVLNPRRHCVTIFVNGKLYYGTYNSIYTLQYTMISISKEFLPDTINDISVILQDESIIQYTTTVDEQHRNLVQIKHNLNEYMTQIFIDGVYISEKMYEYINIDKLHYIIFKKDLDCSNITILYFTRPELEYAILSSTELESSFIDFKNSYIFVGGLLVSRKYLFNVESKNILTVNTEHSLSSDNEIVVYKKSSYDSNMYTTKCIKNILYINDKINLIPYNAFVEYAQTSYKNVLDVAPIYEAPYYTDEQILKFKFLLSELISDSVIVNIGETAIMGNALSKYLSDKYSAIMEDSVIILDANDTTNMITKDLDCND